jgi:thioredoxin-like negative regulator of GroEL
MQDWWVIALCAEWCNVCREWRSTFNDMAASRHDMNFAWVDVEDEADAMGDIDIETFPTVLIAREHQPLFLGPVQPSGAQLTRLIASLRDKPAPSPALPAGAAPLMVRLAAGVLPNP